MIDDYSFGRMLIQTPTKEAVHLFNLKLGEGTHVCAGFHLTC